MTTITAPPLVSNRGQARELLHALPDDLSDCRVELDCSTVKAMTPSFVDEFVKAVLVDRRADHLTFCHASSRVKDIALRSARTRGVAERLDTLSSV